MHNICSNLTGFVHWGEYPLSFAAVLHQEECIRLLVANGANCNAQDSNGNTALHMCVIHNQRDMFDLLHSLGARLGVKNRRGKLSASQQTYDDLSGPLQSL